MINIIVYCVQYYIRKGVLVVVSWMHVLVDFILFSNVIFIFATVFIERKNPTAALGWILTLIFLPVLGFFLYLLFGRNLRLLKKKSFRLKRLNDERDMSVLLQKMNERMYFFHQGIKVNKDYENIIKLIINLADSQYTYYNKIELFTSAEKKYKALFSDIAKAKSTINILYYIIRDDSVGHRLINLLTKKAEEGVRVKILYDDAGSILTPWKMFKPLIKAGGEVKRFFPLKLTSFLRLNFRNHRKIVVIDGKIGYLGGMNIGEEYLGLNPKVSPWRDTHVKLQGEAVYFLQLRFLEDWRYAAGAKDLLDDDLSLYFPYNDKLKELGCTGVQIVSSGPDTCEAEIKRSMIKMIYSAEEKIYLQTPYFIPDITFLEALQSASLAGIEVCLMIPAVPDKKLIYRVTNSYLGDVLRYGVKVYLYPGFLHSKMIIIDDKVVGIGSANIDIRSFSLNFEIMSFMYGTEIVRRCTAVFQQDYHISQEYSIEKYKNRNFAEKIEEGIFRLFSSLF